MIWRSFVYWWRRHRHQPDELDQMMSAMGFDPSKSKAHRWELTEDFKPKRRVF